MLLHSDKWNGEQSHQADVAIVGAGAAGISLALALQDKGISSILVEGGDINYSEASQDLYDGKQFGDYYSQAGLKHSRMRFFGGSTNCWAGGCTVFETHDFAARPWLELQKWPLNYDDLRPFYAKAASQLGLNLETVEAPSSGKRLPNLGPFVTRSLEYTKKIRFKQEYAKDIMDSSNIKCLLSANFECFEKNSHGVSALIVKDYSGHSVKILAKKYVISAGGIESARILMNSARTHGGGFGVEKGNLGRNFCDHPIAPCASVYFDDSTAAKKFLAQSYWAKGTEPYFVLPYEIQKKFEISNCALQVFEEMPPFSESEISALSFYEYLKGVSNNAPEIKDYLNVVTHPVRIWEAWKKRKSGERSRFSIRFQMEQIPVKENGLRLLDEKDAFGLHKVGLDWTMDSFARKTIDVNLYHIVKAFGADQSAVLSLDPQLVSDRKSVPRDLRGGQHHCGTTRMGATSDEGVVDSDLRVFGVDNLHVLSSSVFPSNSWANPTFTIIALSHRLASHIHETL